ncbi:uncharacterized protein LOC118463215 [Anopheles albimanus]|uniref:uncharacterized protein LOC118463215 n=1 Tax=Anopheles albimanus TaxID=7167 RepID=UPI00163FD00E|nr:uncharacterized protein LOC118463215 [Anopheles albimanus]
MEDPAFRAKYQKCKYRLKKWEKEFKQKYGRVPSKLDIRDSSSEIRHSYKVYYRLKTTLLEDTLLDALDEDDDFDGSLISQESSFSQEQLMDGVRPLASGTILNDSALAGQSSSMSRLLTEPIDGSRATELHHRKTAFVAEEEIELNQNAWLNERSRQKPVSKSKEMDSPVIKPPSLKPLSKLLATASAMVPKRNPRKSMSRNSFGGSSQGTAPQGNGAKVVLPDLETLLTAKSKELECLDPKLEDKLLPVTREPINQLDERWLNRQSSGSGIVGEETVIPSAVGGVRSSSSTTGTGAGSYGLRNINVAALASTGSFGLSSLSVLDRPEAAPTTPSSSISSTITDGGKVVAQTTAYDRPPAVQSDSDGVVENSDEECIKTSPGMLHVAKKRKIFTAFNRSPQLLEASKGPGVPNTKEPPSTPVDVENKDPMESAQQQLPNEAAAIVEPKKRAKKAVPKPKPARSTAKKSLQSLKALPQRTRSVRATRKAMNYRDPLIRDGAEPTSPDGAGDFSADDEDKDPNFALKGSPTAGGPSDESHDGDHALATEENGTTPKRKPRSTTRAVVKPPRRTATKRATTRVKKGSPISPRLSPGGSSSKAGSSKGKRKSTKKLPPVANEVPPGGADGEEPEEYVPEYGLDRLKSVPRVDIGELMRDTQLAQSFIQGTTGSVDGVAGGSGRPASSKETAMRKKMAAGKLNENFVRIDLRKKVFVKGKKTINYSRYKKSQWKAKKVAALAGPDMDMGGCDGGVLTCFLCGGVGHIARQCRNVREDKLLPLSAEVEEESSFPTLEEAEAMANAKTAVVHSNRMESLPPVANPTWKESQEAEQTLADEMESELVHGSDCREEMAVKAEEDKPTPQTSSPPRKSQSAAYIGHVIPEDFLKKSGLLEVTVSGAGAKGTIEALYPRQSDGSLPPTPPEVLDALHMFGHKSFRHGQEQAVMRVLCGMSTLVTLSTGAGKSLCYQLPAYLYRKQRNCITLVISPLVSLMEDQVHGVPDFLNAQCLHKNQTPKVRERVMAAIVAGDLDVLLVSPEAVVAGEKSTGFGSLLRQLPPIAFACIDEAHCVSQWSHNFRPSYLMICKVLKEKLGVKTILGLTATATVQTRQSIVKHLAIPDGVNGIISDIPLPDNLLLTISRDENRDIALVELLLSERFASLESIIVYCTRRDDCERIATFIRTCFQDAARARAEAQEKAGSNKRRRLNYVAEPYHAGMPASRRRTIQNAFMNGELRIVVATIAFGMGINKADIRAIVHYNMPKNFESYVQEVGRAGRDGLLSHCHLFLDNRGNDRNELRRFIYANSIDRHVVRKLLQKIFVPCACTKIFSNHELADELRQEIEAANGMDWDAAFDEAEATEKEGTEALAVPKRKRRLCPGHEICFSIESTIQQLDIPEENIATFLCYLELDEHRYIQALSPAYIRCKVMSYAGPRALRQAAKECAPLAMAFALDLKRGISHATSTMIEFPVIDVASAIGWDSGVVKYQLKNLEWISEGGTRKRSALSVSFFDLGFRVRAPGDLTDEELDHTLDTLYGRVTHQERTQLAQLQYISDALNAVCFKSIHPIKAANCPTGPSDKLKAIIREYFVTDISKEDIEIVAEPDDTTDEQLVTDIRTMICRYPENNFSGRAIARIFHGVQSPNYSAITWSRSNFWRSYTKTDFNRIVRLANAEIVRMKT